VQRALLERVARAPQHPRLEHHTAIDLIMLSRFGGPDVCVGAYVLDERTARQTYLARATVLATGGAGKVYLYTSNPDVATGDGVAMAYRAGRRDREHGVLPVPPHLPLPPGGQELPHQRGAARRGRRAAARSTARLHGAAPRAKDLAPRDIVARAIDHEMKRTGAEHVYLDITHKPASFVRERFPNIYAECLASASTSPREPIPVVPAAHYMCGGVATDLDGRTTMPGLYAIGEVACTGPARRQPPRLELAARGPRLRPPRALARSIADAGTRRVPTVPDWDVGDAVPSDEASSSRRTGTSCAASCGTTSASCAPTSACAAPRAASRCSKEEIREYYWKHLVTRDLLELRNIATSPS
jgi:L-aspartate oxidase